MHQHHLEESSLTVKTTVQETYPSDHFLDVYQIRFLEFMSLMSLSIRFLINKTMIFISMRKCSKSSFILMLSLRKNFLRQSVVKYALNLLLKRQRQGQANLCKFWASLVYIPSWRSAQTILSETLSQKTILHVLIILFMLSIL